MTIVEVPIEDTGSSEDAARRLVLDVNPIGLVASALQFANPWHDELGRFAPKGTGKKSFGHDTRWRFDEDFGRKPWDPSVPVQYMHEGVWIEEDWAFKHYGALETSFSMTDEERELLLEELAGMRNFDLQVIENALTGDWYLPRPPLGVTGDDGFKWAGKLENMPAGVWMQWVSVDEFVSEAGNDINLEMNRAGTIDTFDQWRELQVSFGRGEISAEELSAVMTDQFNVSIEAAAVSYFHKGWQDSAASVKSQALQTGVADMFGLGPALESYRGYVESPGAHPSPIADRVLVAEVLADALPATAVAVAAATYRTTQEMLAESGTTRMRLHRGVTGDAFDAISPGSQLQSNPLSSWTENDSVAADFATTYSASGEGRRVLLTGTIPAADIWGFYGVGAGSAKEVEFITLGRPVTIEMLEDFAVITVAEPIFIDADEHGGPDWIKFANQEPVVASAAEFANPWHDELGRFAPKGTGRHITRGTRDRTELEGVLDDPSAEIVELTEAVLDRRGGGTGSGHNELMAKLAEAAPGAGDRELRFARNALVDQLWAVRQSEIALDQIAKTMSEQLGQTVTAAMVEEAYLTEVRAGLAAAPVSMRVPEGVLGVILDSGEFKTQFETNSSSGQLDPWWREEVEMGLFALDPTATPAKDRPVYGYMDVNGSNLQGRTAEMLEQYGDVRIEFKDDVRARTTFTAEDSLGTMLRPSPIDDPAAYSLSPSMATLSEPFRYGGSSHSGMTGYTEAQIHGDTTIDDIARVVFNSVPASSVQENLDARGIEWTMTDRLVDEVLDPALAASAGEQPILADGYGATVDVVGSDEWGPLGVITRDGVRYDPRSLKAILVHGSWKPAALTAAAEFANPWHDELGRFAPKGMGRRVDTAGALAADARWEAEHDQERPSGMGDCYPAAYRTLAAMPKEMQDRGKVVHGTAIGQGEIAGVEFTHAWVEVTEPGPLADDPAVADLLVGLPAFNVTVHDKSNGLDVEMPAVVYYGIGSIDPASVTRYTMEETMVNMAKYNHYGPWEEDL